MSAPKRHPVFQVKPLESSHSSLSSKALVNQEYRCLADASTQSSVDAEPSSLMQGIPQDRIKYDEICRNFVKGSCVWGHRCHRIHPPDNQVTKNNRTKNDQASFVTKVSPISLSSHPPPERQSEPVLTESSAVPSHRVLSVPSFSPLAEAQVGVDVKKKRQRRKLNPASRSLAKRTSIELESHESVSGALPPVDNSNESSVSCEKSTDLSKVFENSYLNEAGRDLAKASSLPQPNVYPHRRINLTSRGAMLKTEIVTHSDPGWVAGSEPQTCVTTHAIGAGETPLSTNLLQPIKLPKSKHRKPIVISEVSADGPNRLSDSPLCTLDNTNTLNGSCSVEPVTLRRRHQQPAQKVQQTVKSITEGRKDSAISLLKTEQPAVAVLPRTLSQVKANANHSNQSAMLVDSELPAVNVAPICRNFLKKRCQNKACKRVHPNVEVLNLMAQDTSPNICQPYLRGLCQDCSCTKEHIRFPISTAERLPAQTLETQSKSFNDIVMTPDQMQKALKPTLTSPPPSPGRKKSPKGMRGKEMAPLVNGIGFPVSEVTQIHTPPMSPNAEVSPNSHEVLADLLTHRIFYHIKVQYDAGFAINHVVTGFETCWVVLGKVSSRNTQESIMAILAPFGQVKNIHLPPSRMTKSAFMTVRVQFATPDEAVLATSALNGTNVMGYSVTAHMPVGDTNEGFPQFDDVTLRITWNAPGRSAFAGYATQTAARMAVANADGRDIDRNVIAAEEYEGLPTLGTYNVRYRFLPPGFTQKDMERFGDAEEIMLERPNYASIDTVAQYIRGQLVPFGQLINFEVQQARSENNIVARAHFADPTSAKRAALHIDGLQVPSVGDGLMIRARHSQTVSYTLSPGTYDVIGPDLSRLRRSLTAARSTLKVTDGGVNTASPVVHIRITSDDARSLSRLKCDLEEIIAGEVIRNEQQIVWDDILGLPHGQAFLREIEAKVGNIIINASKASRRVTVIGAKHRRRSARLDIVNYVKHHHNQQVRRVDLAGCLASALVNSKLLDLCKRLGNTTLQLESGRQELIVRGSNTFIDNVQAIVDEIRHQAISKANVQSPNACPICLERPTGQISLPCGHVWCRQCLVSYLSAAASIKKFPVQCLGDEASCHLAIPLSMAQGILSSEQLDDLLKSSFLAYIDSKPTEFFHCPTVDCEQVYRIAPQDTVLQCPSCLARVCPNCHTLAHDHIKCSQVVSRDDELLRKWEGEHDVKKCPGCRVLIEKVDGCNHMTCTRCQTHVCWTCMEVFDQGTGIYDHMRARHGSLY